MEKRATCVSLIPNKSRRSYNANLEIMMMNHDRKN
jgi:hypothetical protein